ncbi:hypothetical protein ACKWTF_001532 [Chironomus riparius]
MNFKVCLSILILSINCCSILAQSEILSANYTTSYNNLCAYLTVNNPNGLNNFNDITDVDHMTGKSDDDVKYVYRVTKSVSRNIPSIICEKYKSATTIDLQSMGVERIDDYSFRGCKNITYIYLYGNKITEVHEKSFSENLLLQSLSLTSNKLTTLPDNLFVNQEKLENLQLDNNLLLNLQNNIFRPLINLKSLYLRNLQLTTAKPEWFETLGMLKTLDLQSNLIEELPKNIFNKLVNITYISLRYNKFKVLYADSFGYLLSSPNIDLYSNKIYAVDEQFIYNVGPSSIDLQSNICGEKRISDTSVYRVIMRTALKGCIENYYTFIGQPSTTTTTEVSNPSLTTQEGSTLNPSTENIENRVFLLECKVENLTSSNDQMTANWKNQYLPSANNQEEIRRLQNKVFDLQASSDVKDNLIDEIKAENQQLKNVTSNMQTTLDAVLKDKVVMQNNFQNNIVSLTTELQNLQSQVRELMSCVFCG